MIVCQKLDVILESKVVQKLSLEKNVFNKQWSPRFIFLDKNFFEKIWLIFDIQNWLWKYNFGTFWQNVIIHRMFLKIFPWYHVDSWPRSLLLRTHHLWNSTTELILFKCHSLLGSFKSHSFLGRFKSSVSSVVEF